MKLEDQVVNLELAKQLKELGVKQESQFIWAQIQDSTGEVFDPEILDVGNPFQWDEEGVDYPPKEWPGFIASAFTVAELGEILPENYFSYRLGQSWFNAKFIDPWKTEKLPVGVSVPTEANARAKMLIYLLENKLITL